ncbi:ArsR/SmtB family transcription factor [Singulisphaera sp. PoT]|uniref:ArsR/SmtB family transcription factor n=1 Tax=Singulisphaera sp. PoT TaxID=3411797 RepID=UPI003BF4EC39
MATATQERPAKAKQAGGKGATAEAGSTAKARGGTKAGQQQETTRLTDKVRGHVTAGLSLVADETKFRILEMLSEREWNVGDMCTDLTISQPAISHHLAILRHARLVESKRDGKFNIYRLSDTGKQLWAACSGYARAIASSA